MPARPGRFRAQMVLLAALALAACSPPAAVPEPVRAVRSVVVGAGQLGGSHEFAAEIKPRSEARLGFRIGGKLLKRQVEVGQTVRAGQMLAQLDPLDMKLSSDAAKAATASAQASFDMAAADFKRFKELREQGFISSAELDRRDMALKAAQAQLDQARANAGMMGNQAGYTSLLASAGGVVTAVEAEPGMVLAAGATVLRLALDGARDAVFAVPEDQVNLIKQLAASDTAFNVRLWDAAAKPLPAKVREISAAADAATRTFAVKLDVGSPAGLRLGQTATVVMDLPRQANAIKLPLSALKEEKGTSHVWLLDTATMKVLLHPVVVAGADGNEAVIASGLQPGQRVVTAGVHVLTPGQVVRLYEEPVATLPPAAAASRAAK